MNPQPKEISILPLLITLALVAAYGRAYRGRGIYRIAPARPRLLPERATQLGTDAADPRRNAGKFSYDRLFDLCWSGPDKPRSVVKQLADLAAAQPLTHAQETKRARLSLLNATRRGIVSRSFDGYSFRVACV